MFLPFADQLISQLKARFNRLTMTAVSGLVLMPEKATDQTVFFLPGTIGMSVRCLWQRLASSRFPFTRDG